MVLTIFNFVKKNEENVYNANTFSACLVDNNLQTG